MSRRAGCLPQIGRFSLVPSVWLWGKSLLAVSLQFFRELGSRLAPSSSQKDGGGTEGIRRLPAAPNPGALLVRLCDMPSGRVWLRSPDFGPGVLSYPCASRAIGHQGRRVRKQFWGSARQLSAEGCGSIALCLLLFRPWGCVLGLHPRPGSGVRPPL